MLYINTRSRKKKQTILPSPIAVNDVEALYDISSLLENTASRIVSNAITETSSFWRCSICNEKKSQFSNINKSRSINEEVLSFGISPLHARIRFLDYFLHIAYDLKYRRVPENLTKSTKNNEELKELRAAEKSRIQEEFKVQMGLNIDKPLPSCGSTNDGNTARRFFRDFEITSRITGIDKELLRRIFICCNMLNCTDLACVLHHHHFYAHLHHLKNHLQDDNDHQVTLDVNVKLKLPLISNNVSRASHIFKSHYILVISTSMWLNNSLLRKNQNIFEFFIPSKYSKLDNLLYYGSENKTELPVTQSDLSDGSSELSSFSHVVS
ncbi:hypothetical protein CVS40_10437 [Lucilia cuprina]|nr:hypothetical protein CVS40_10437 [Lucilia cuprina]